jgi:putative MATE family efflux protein
MTQSLTDIKEIRREIRWLSIPLVIETVFALSGTMIFMAFLNRIGSVGLPALRHVSVYGLATTVTGIVWNLTKGISIGAMIAISRAYGAQDHDRLRRLAAQAVSMLFAIGVIFGVILFVFAESVMSFYKPDPVTKKIAVEYLRVCSFGFPFLGLLHASTGIMQGLGDTKTPMRLSMILNITFLVVGLPLVMGWIGRPIGVIGAGYSLVAGQAVTGILGQIALFSRRGPLFGIRKEGYFSPDLEKCLHILKLGLPTSLETIFWLFGAMVLGRVMLGFGELDYAANQIGIQTEAIATLPTMSFGIVAMTLGGRAVGAGDNRLGATYMKAVRRACYPVVLVGAFILLVLPVPLLHLMTGIDEVIGLSTVYLRIMGLCLAQHALTQIYYASLKASGYTRVPMLIALIGIWGIRVPLSILAASIEGSNIIWLWAVMVIDLNFRFIAAIFMNKKKNVFKVEDVVDDPVPD